jgi:hypothetical protein
MSRRHVVCLLALALSGPARADVVSDWTSIATETVRAEQSRPALAAHDLATAQIALSEAINFVEDRHAPRYLIRPQKPAVSGEAVGVAAIRHVLAELYPARKDQLEERLRRTLAAIPGDHTEAVEIGDALGAIIRVVRDVQRPERSIVPVPDDGPDEED